MNSDLIIKEQIRRRHCSFMTPELILLIKSESIYWYTDPGVKQEL